MLFFNILCWEFERVFYLLLKTDISLTYSHMNVRIVLGQGPCNHSNNVLVFDNWMSNTSY